MKPSPPGKVCGKCDFKNSAAKNYCDQCGTALAVMEAPGAAQAAPSASSASSDIPRTAILSLPPSAGNELKTPPSRETPPGPSTLSALRKRDRRHNMSMIFLLTVLAAFGVYRWSLYMRPEQAAPRLAAKYLRLLQAGEFERAYNMFSAKAKGHCSLEDFKAARDQTSWTWSDVKTVRVEADAAIVSYTLSVDGRPREDFLHFIREDGEWVRPYNWTLLQKAEAALQRNDSDMALLLSQAAVEINTRDPLSRGYLCEAVFYRGVPAETARECALAIQLSQLYPSTLSMKSLFHLHSILGDTYKNDLRRYPEALEQYNTLLSFPDLSASQRCRLFLARSATESALGRPAEAKSDLNSAAGLCVDPAELEFIRSRQTPR